MDYKKVEDGVLKYSAKVFAKGYLKLIGNEDKEVITVGFTDLTELQENELKQMHMDYTYLLNDDTYMHFEFQSTDKKNQDLKRFMKYQVYLYDITDKKVHTYIFYSGNIKKPDKIKFSIGDTTAVFNAISWANYSWDEVYSRIINNVLLASEDDYLLFSMSSLLSSNLSIVERAIKTIKVANELKNEYTNSIKGITYLLATKFLTDEELKKVEEVMSLENFGKDILEQGREQGREEQKRNTIINMLKNKLAYNDICELVPCTEKEIKEVEEKYLN